MFFMPSKIEDMRLCLRLRMGYSLLIHEHLMEGRPSIRCSCRPLPYHEASRVSVLLPNKENTLGS